MLDIDIFSDLICPWCFVGKRRLDRLRPQLPFELKVRWRAYELRPATPVGGTDRLESLRLRYGPDAELERIPERLASEAAREGIELRYDRVTRVPNTRAGHRLMSAAAGTPDLQHALADRLFEAYFVEGQDVEDLAVLSRAASAVGLAPATVRVAQAESAYESDVAADRIAAEEHQISGVPSLILAGRFPLPGVQNDDVLLKFLGRAHERLARA